MTEIIRRLKHKWGKLADESEETVNLSNSTALSLSSFTKTSYFISRTRGGLGETHEHLERKDDSLVLQTDAIN